MSKQKTTDLFRFVTLRSPESLTSERKQLGFIPTFTKSESHFLRHAEEEFPDKVDEAIRTFELFLTVSQLVDKVGNEMWDFATWLANHKSTLSYETLSKSPKLSLLNGEAENLLWDNLYYSILTKSKHEIRQAILQVLVASRFASEYRKYVSSTDGISPDNEMSRGDEPLDINNPDLSKAAEPSSRDQAIATETQLLRRLANSKVVIPKVLIQKTRTTKREVQLEVPITALNRQATQLEAKMAQEQLPIFKAIEKELGCFEKEYQKEYDEALKPAKQRYERQVEDAVTQYLRENPDIANREGLEYLIPDSVIPEFTFNFPTPFSADNLKRLSPAAAVYIQDHCLSDQPVKNVIEHVQENLQKTAVKASASTRKQVKDILVNGILMKPNPAENVTFGLQPKNTTTADAYTFFLLLNTEQDGVFFETAQIRLTVDGSTYTDNEPVMKSAKNGAVFAELFVKEPITIPQGKSYHVNAELTLNNGKTYGIDKFGWGVNEGIYGLATLAKKPDDPSPEDCGVTRIGIAEFRKVEQELCCYIPGEVSHIENILAKEYKERATRNLTKTETAVESTTEREMEELSDTTSATKHEMSSEVAEVIERDRESNFGFSAGVNGKYGNAFSYSANATGDFSFGQSTSDSNTIARTYAEDVTRRALERIVQKTAVKRTSRIIKEFEENNKHGYDNRNGEDHVTGIFRWVDKVYKNRIVNYGYRLIYEFMVPEPARFYKQAIVAQAEEEGASTGAGGAGSNSIAVKPTSPVEYGIKNAASITRDNYANFASLYGISLESPLEEFAKASNSYSQSYGNDDKPRSFSDNNLRVPENYECFQVNGTASYHYKARVKDWAYIKIGIIGQNLDIIDLKGDRNDSRPVSFNYNNVSGAIPVSISTKKIVSFTVSIEAKCRLKTSVFEQWQQTAYADIMRAYDTQLQAFNDAQAMAAVTEETERAEAETEGVGSNPLYNAEVVKTELKRLCIEMLMKPFGLKQGRDFYKNGECDVPELQSCDGLNEYADQIKFFELAFEWDLMYQKFLPYYWAKRCDWKVLFQSKDGNDPDFQAFLQSGMARVVVPVRQGYEDTVLFYMSSGEVWKGSGIIPDANETFMDLMDDLTKNGGTVEGSEWETTVPSTLTILQARAALLEDEGLPCCHKPVSDDTSDLNILVPHSKTLALKD